MFIQKVGAAAALQTPFRIMAWLMSTGLTSKVCKNMLWVMEELATKFLEQMELLNVLPIKSKPQESILSTPVVLLQQTPVIFKEH